MATNNLPFVPTGPVLFTDDADGIKYSSGGGMRKADNGGIVFDMSSPTASIYIQSPDQPSPVAVISASGVSSSATKLQTPRKINGVDFDGTADITIENSIKTLTLDPGSFTGGSFDGTTDVTLNLSEVGTAGTFGNVMRIPTITVDSKGRVTSASDAPFAVPVTSVNAKTGAVVLTKSDIGLGNVADLAPADLPISTETQTALNGKLDATAAAVSAAKWTTPRTLTLTGPVTGSTSIDGSANVSIATTIKKCFYQDIYTWTGTQTVVSGTPFNYFTLTLTPDAANDNFSSISANNMLISSEALKTQILFRIRLAGTIAGASGTAREWANEIRRINGTTIVGADNNVKITGTDISNRDSTLVSFTSGPTDPFTVDGLRLYMANNSTQTITLTSLSITVQRVINQ